MLTVRAAVESDWAAYRDARLEALRSTPDAYGSTYAREIEFDEAIWRDRCRTAAGRSCFVAVDEQGRIAGMATGLADDEIPDDQRLLVGMWIYPQHRGSGLVDRLTDAVAGWARADGAVALRLDVTDTNEPARRAYLRLGFRPTGERHPLPGRPHLLEQVMTRPLRAAVSEG